MIQCAKSYLKQIYNISLFTIQDTQIYKSIQYTCMKIEKTSSFNLIGSTFVMNKLCENDYGKQPIKDLLKAKSKT